MKHADEVWIADADNAVSPRPDRSLWRKIRLRNGWAVATVWGTAHDPQRLADRAALIAAAPELLRELRDFHDHTIDQGWHDCEGIPGGCPVAAAIRKAEGGGA